ncbi:SDR family oxidoreductase, partial [Kineococcus sp. SYSU DK003]|uniref:SDR family oxidoreductase n=1 Tax=Kineococcus sp. SYSU DK003 TaxID=3383124 RepID=UPI003D7D2CEE
MSYQTGTGQRTAVVTGAASPRGIGFATARRFAAEGWTVALLDVDQAGAEAAADKISSEFGTAVLGLAADVTDQASLTRCVEAIAAAG